MSESVLSPRHPLPPPEEIWKRTTKIYLKQTPNLRFFGIRPGCLGVSSGSLFRFFIFPLATSGLQMVCRALDEFETSKMVNAVWTSEWWVNTWKDAGSKNGGFKLLAHFEVNTWCPEIFDVQKIRGICIARLLPSSIATSSPWMLFWIWASISRWERQWGFIEQEAWCSEFL